MDYEDQCMILDSGSHKTRAGYADPMSEPPTVIRSEVALLTDELGDNIKRYAVGPNMGSKMALGQLQYPVQYGQVQDWDAMEALCNHVLFNELGVEKGRESPLLFLEPVRTSKTDRETMTQILFESFELPKVYMADQAVATCYGFSSSTGLVVDIGYQRTDITPVIGWSPQHHLRQSLDIGGSHLDEYFLELLQKTEKSFREQVPVEAQTKSLAESIRLALGAVAPSSKTALSGKGFTPPEWLFNWREQESITIGLSRVRYAEALFYPSTIGVEAPGLVDLIHTAINRCEPDKRRALLGNIMLTGSVSRTSGLVERVKADLERSFHSAKSSADEEKANLVSVATLPSYLNSETDRVDLASWIGASIASKVIFSSHFNITRADYNEHGPSVVHLKAFNT